MSSDEDGDLVFSSGLSLTKRNKLLKRFVPVQLFANSSVRRIKEIEMTFRRVKILECVVSVIVVKFGAHLYVFHFFKVEWWSHMNVF